MHTTLIATSELQALMDAHTPLRVFDCSFDLMNPSAGRAQFLQAHLPGARQADLDRYLSAHTGSASASGGRHPLPTREAFATWLAQAGVDANMQVVVYDRQAVNYCELLWWMLKWCGHEAVAVLDGGLQAWQAACGAVDSGPAEAGRPGSFVLQPAQPGTADTSGIASRLGARRQTLIDARGAPRFRGEIEPLDMVAGQIPGALNRPFADNLGPDCRFKLAQQPRRVRGSAGRARPGHSGPPLRQWRERRAQPAGHGNGGPGPRQALPRQLERMVQHAGHDLCEDLSSSSKRRNVG